MPLVQISGLAPPGTAERGLVIPGLLANALPTVIGLSCAWRCTASDGTVTTGTEVVGTNLDISVEIDDSAVRISTGTGLSASGTGAQSNDAPDVTGSWSLQGATN